MNDPLKSRHFSIKRLFNVSKYLLSILCHQLPNNQQQHKLQKRHREQQQQQQQQQ